MMRRDGHQDSFVIVSYIPAICHSMLPTKGKTDTLSAIQAVGQQMGHLCCYNRGIKKNASNN